jgi:hypothetical protein
MESGITTTILGKTSTGKTCYLMALYNMMKAGITVDGSQLTLAMPIDKVADDNFLRKQYKNLRGLSRWPTPNPTAEIKEYQLYFCKDLIERFPFTWIDYSGELLEEEGHEAQDAYKKVTDRTKKESTSVLFPLKGELFAEPIPTDEWELSFFKNDNGYDTFNELMSEYIVSRKSNGRPPIIVLLITMYDLCRARDFNDIVNEIQILFPALFNKKGDCFVGIIPISLGHQQGEKFVVRPYQVHLPLVFILLKELEISLKIAELAKEKAGQTIKRERDSFWGSLKEFFDINKDITKAQTLQNEANKYITFFSPYSKMFNRTLQTGRLVFFDDLRHDIGVEIK